MSDVEMMDEKDALDESAEKTDTEDDESSEGTNTEDEDTEDDENDESIESKHIKEYIEILTKIAGDKYNYDNYAELLEVAHQMNDLEKIRQSAEIFSAMYPLSPEIWLKWLKIESSLATTDEQVEKVEKLFQRALNDYYSAEVALEFAELAMKTSSKDISLRIWKTLIPTYGLHTVKGRSIFEAYREDTLTKNGDSPASFNLLARIYEQELKIPLRNMEDSYIEYKLLCEKYKDVITDLDEEKFERRYKQAKDALQRMLSHENALAALGSHCHQERADLYRKYIAECQAVLDDDEVQILYERMVTECCLDGTVWYDYVRYLHRCPPDPEENSASPVFRQTELELVNRALRNCTWSAELYVEKMRIVERQAKPSSKMTILKIMEDVASAGLQTPEASVKVWLEYLTYLRRVTDFTSEKERDILRANFDLAWNQLGRTWGVLADPQCKILQFWGRLEYEALGEPSKGRDLWYSVMDSADNSTRVGLWIEFIELEAKRGADAVRKLYRKSINCAGLDDPETLAAAWLRFERCNGTLDQLITCQELCNATIEKYYKTLSKNGPPNRVAKGKRTETGGTSANKETEPSTTKRHTSSVDGPSGSPGKKKLKRTHDQMSDSTGERQVEFKTPAIPVANNSKHHENKHDPANHPKMDDDNDYVSKGDQNRQVFISNLSFEVTEPDIRAIFPELTIDSIELVASSSGKSRGFGYMQLASAEEVPKALGFDRRPLNGRPVFISNVARDKATRQHQFKYSSSFEPNKLFIKGLPFNLGRNELEKLFEPFGPIRDIRIVCYRSGKSKGLAYLEYETESAAKKAVLKMDQHVIDGFTITVAISSPPPKKNPTATEPNLAVGDSGSSSFSLGSGKKQLAKGDVKQKLSPMIPTAVLKKNAASTVTASEDKPKSNDDFRKLLLK
ncbi:squamous cell carcinoma antigen recognized by T-cells 3 isoform X2 [Anopheles funestus]|uniref:squamous cell carcinoma antigen recognized by T-cells 3 isoform X2 n=1 Tax=Anopheles funestus TaxID=62324 RepID=UPI0020C60B28|nr:squamous cell carcinoma antigen recognized by T-cells 3 isoform X2 [Anopheles funestus]